MIDRNGDTVVVFGSISAVIAVGLLASGLTEVELSLTVRAVLLGILVVALIVVQIAHPRLTTVGILGVATAIVSGYYVPFLFGYGAGVAFLLAWPVALLVLGVFYTISKGNIHLTSRTVQVVLGVLVVVGVAVVGIDLSVGAVEYTISLEDQVRVSDEELTVVAGTARAQTTSFLREPADFPDLRACLYTDRGRSELGWVYGDGWADHATGVPGSGSLTLDVRLLFSEPQRQNAPASLPVERAESCPDGRDTPGIVVVVRPDG